MDELFLSFQLERRPGLVLLTVIEPLLVGDRLHRFDRELERLQPTLGAEPLVLDMRRVDLVGSLFLGRLAALHRQLNPRGGEVRICNVNHQFAEAVRISKVQSFFRLFKTLDEALQG